MQASLINFDQVVCDLPSKKTSGTSRIKVKAKDIIAIYHINRNKKAPQNLLGTFLENHTQCPKRRSE